MFLGQNFKYFHEITSMPPTRKPLGGLVSLIINEVTPIRGCIGRYEATFSEASSFLHEVTQLRGCILHYKATSLEAASFLY